MCAWKHFSAAKTSMAALRQSLLAALASLPLAFGVAQAAEVKVIAANAVKEGYAEVVAAFERASGHTVTTTWTGTVAGEKRLAAGEIFDIVLIGSDAIERLIAAGKLSQDSRVDFARTGIAVAVRDGLPKPDVSTPEAVKAAVMAAGSIVYSAGPSGAHVDALLKRWDIREPLAGRIKQPASGAEVAQVLSRGEADLGFAQVSEFRGVSGIQNLGPLPAAIQNVTVYSAARHRAASAADAAAALLTALRSQDAAPSVRRMGMEPG